MKTPKKSDAKKIINDLYRKKHDGKDIVTRTFSRLYDDTRPATPMEIEEVPQVQVIDNADAEKSSTSYWPKKQPKITSFFTSN